MGGPEKSVISSLYKSCFLCHFEEMRLRSNFDSREKHSLTWGGVGPPEGELEAPLQVFIKVNLLVSFSRFETKKQFWPEGKRIPSSGTCDRIP